MAEYQGHRSRAAWNVALWIGNDELLYRRAIYLKQQHGAKAAAKLLAELPERTPDGYRYTLTSVKAALVGLE